MPTFDSKSYGPVIGELLRERRLAELGPGRPNESIRAKLEALTIDEAFTGTRSRDMVSACLAGLWLYHDFLGESHKISQEIATPTGSYWHGLMHRREPDFANSKYWFHRVGKHPVFPAVHAAAGELAAETELPESARFLSTQAEWDPFAFIDLCESCIGSQSPSEMLCRQVQHREWEILFDYCYRQALGV